MGRKQFTTHRGQMSEAFLTAAFLSLSGGLQDAYSYIVRGEVFANAQTGNIVLFNISLFGGDWGRCLHYLIPVLCFAMGVLATEAVRDRFQQLQRLHWRQLVLLAEIVLLFVVGFFPSRLDMLANAIVSFSCAMQVQAFRKVDGYAFASTMCIGNLRSGVEALAAWRRSGEEQMLRKAVHYGSIILLFGLGAGLGGLCIPALGHRTIWLSCGLLAVSFCLMFIREDLEENPAIRQDLAEIRRDTADIGQRLREELRPKPGDKR